MKTLGWLLMSPLLLLLFAYVSWLMYEWTSRMYTTTDKRELAMNIGVMISLLAFFVGLILIILY